ncbi:hypothetical protein [Leptolyngbya sp. FACHB-17]|uniref:hypothetical protein n=1 Tax=unclassified Leptolyngbya TaxID=2650499 RepID=UPI0016816F48|nr:hypothetical protein [Leptolyngbya sp. FACHB-17]MBD2080501.1 hypothetical protein [Leptolyngbya sp. FACHB-17]
MAFPSLQSHLARLVHSANPQEPLPLSRKTQLSRFIPFVTCLGLTALLIITHFPVSIWFMVALAALVVRFVEWVPLLTSQPWFHGCGGWRVIGAIFGALCFAGITLSSDPASAQLFNSAEQQANTIFGQYIDGGIITFLFGLLRIVVWVTAVGFVLFAVYQAQRGEQWQPLMQNAFIVVAAVVVVEGLSAMFFGGGTAARG